MDHVNIELLVESHAQLLEATQSLLEYGKDAESKFVPGSTIAVMKAKWAIDDAKKLQSKIIKKELSYGQ